MYNAIVRNEVICLEAVYKELVIHDLCNYKQIIDNVLNEFKIDDSDTNFDLRLILVEALTNAFKHGNGGDANKAIKLRYSLCNGKVKFEVEDMGQGLEDAIIPQYISDCDVCNNSGRGLFLISCLADKIEINKNILIVEKNYM